MPSDVTGVALVLSCVRWMALLLQMTLNQFQSQSLLFLTVLACVAMVCAPGTWQPDCEHSVPIKSPEERTETEGKVVII